MATRKGFSIREDLGSRPVEQNIEILCISGPMAGKYMRLLVDGEVKEVEQAIGQRLGKTITISEALRSRLVTQYGSIAD